MNTFTYNSHTYTLVTTPKTWLQAKSHAESLGGYLAIVSSLEENDRILTEALNYLSTAPSAQDGGGARYVWLGASDLDTEGTWKWIDGSRVSAGYSVWGAGTWGTEPDNFEGQDALALGLEPWPAPSGGIGVAGKWNDVDENNALYFVVETEPLLRNERKTKGHPLRFYVMPKFCAILSAMTKPRSSLVSLADTPWYHVVNRCVRRAFLCGDDAVTGKNHDHRRGWIVDRVKQLAGVFAIDVAAYAVMSNHYHLVLRVDAERARGWSNEEVLRRWTQLFDGPLLVQRLLSGQGGEMDQATLNAIDEWTETYRSRLCDLSWFMRILNETVARQANAEDEVTGRFWEGRFKSQALLDEQAILTAMAYVDLNPIRAKMAETPEASEHTSVAERMAELKPAPQQPKKPVPSSTNQRGQGHLIRLISNIRGQTTFSRSIP